MRKLLPALACAAIALSGLACSPNKTPDGGQSKQDTSAQPAAPAQSASAAATQPTAAASSTATAAVPTTGAAPDQSKKPSAASISAGTSATDTQSAANAKKSAKKKSSLVKTASGLQYTDLNVGTGSQAKVGQTVSVNYVGMLEDGTKFDSSYGKAPITFVLGSHKVIQGWEEGIASMHVGGERFLVIPPELAYGDQAKGSIPANSTLYFHVQLMSAH